MRAASFSLAALSSLLSNYSSGYVCNSRHSAQSLTFCFHRFPYVSHALTVPTEKKMWKWREPKQFFFVSLSFFHCSFSSECCESHFVESIERREEWNQSCCLILAIFSRIFLESLCISPLNCSCFYRYYCKNNKKMYLYNSDAYIVSLIDFFFVIRRLLSSTTRYSLDEHCHQL